MKSAIKRLRLKPGDIIVVRDHQTADALMCSEPFLKFNVPILILHSGSVKRFSRKYLEKLLDKSPKDAE